MILIELTYKVAESVVMEHVQDHRDFLDQYYREGLFLFSGPKNPKVGGVIIAMGNDVESVKDIMERDPFYARGVANYRYVCFDAVKYQNALEMFV